MKAARRFLTVAISSVTFTLLLLLLAGFIAAEDEPQVLPQEAPKEAVKTDAPLIRENTRLIDRTGVILCLRDDLGIGNVPRSVFRLKGDLGYFILMENTFLEKVEDQTRHGEREVRISGTVTEYRGQNYLLLTRVFLRRD